ncbi:BamA/TamA family outer membrane protein [bacterium]|nr:BamA/TamA family outer membrane protein [bacterium]
MIAWKKTFCLLLAVNVLPVYLAAKTDSTQTKGFFAYPILFYTPETRLAYGAAMTVFTRDPKNTRPSSWIPMFVYTQNKQIIAKLLANLYGKEEKWQLDAWLGYYDYPDKFFGIGNQTTDDQKESYTAERVVIQLSPRWHIQSGLYVGVQYEFMHQQLSELKEDGTLILGNIPGSHKSQYAGIGALISKDTRDNIYFPVKGYYYSLQYAGFGSLLGSDFSFQRLNVNLRQYLPVRTRHVMAMQFYSQMIFGTAPFQTLSGFGGTQIMRGYYEGRYRDNHVLVLQTEYRFFFTELLGAAFFGNAGEVAHDFSHFQINQFKYSVGFGFRFCINPKEKLNLRLDVAYGKNTSGYYVEIFEAF